MRVRISVVAVVFLGSMVWGSVAVRAHVIPVETGDHIRLYDAPDQYSNGGPFWVDNLRDNDPKAEKHYEFLTFCLERDETISYNTEYHVVLSDTAWLGGRNTNSGDPLDSRTAYLYSNFFHETDIAEDWDTEDLQQVIWFLENEFDGDRVKNPTGYGYHDFGYGDLLAVAKDLYDLADGIEHDGSLYDVQVMNLYEGGTHRQSLLTVVPEPATLVLWGICGVCGLAVIRRRKRAA